MPNWLAIDLYYVGNRGSLIWLRRDREVSVDTVAISIAVSTRRLGTDVASAGIRVGLGTAGVRRDS